MLTMPIIPVVRLLCLFITTAFKELCGFPLEENMTPYKRLRSLTSKVVARALTTKTKQDLINLCQNSTIAFSFLRIKKEDA